jgi:hypothetical protein
MRSEHLYAERREWNSADSKSRTLFRNLILALAECGLDDSSAASKAATGPYSALSSIELKAYINNKYLLRTVFEDFQDCHEGFPFLYRRKLGPHLDLSAATTYGEAAQIVVRSMAGRPGALQTWRFV